MQALVIGCGYLGQRVAQRWTQAGHQVWTVTRSVARASDFAARGWTPVVADVCEPAGWSELPPFDVVLWAVGYDRAAGSSQHAVYVDGFSQTLELLQDRVRHWISISSSSVYGQHEGEWVDEASPCEPAQPGGQCCLLAEQRLMDVSRTAGFRANVLRLSGIYGPGRLLSRLDGLRQREPLAGSPESWLNLIHVDDAATAVLQCRECGASGETYLVSDDEPVRRGDYYAHLAELAALPAPVFNESLAPRRGAGGLNKRCRNEKLRRNLRLTLHYPTYRDGLPMALAAGTEPPRSP